MSAPGDVRRGTSGVATTGFWSGRIVHHLGILDGEPTVKGTRIPVRSIVQTYAIYGDIHRVHQAYPSLAAEDIQAALEYHHHHRDEIQRYIDENDADD